ncbi:MAG: hypothetical protein AAF633_02575 [Chloroflexota bacterium]
MPISILLLGTLLLAACNEDQPTEDQVPSQTPNSQDGDPILAVSSPASTRDALNELTDLFPMRPTATANPIRNQPIAIPEGWQSFSEPSSGLSLSAPAGWLDVSKLAGLEPIDAQFKQSNLLVVANSPDTSIELITGREFEEGGFVIGLSIDTGSWNHPLFGEINGSSPVDNLEAILLRIGVRAPAVPLTGGRYPIAYTQLLDDPLGSLLSSDENKSFYMALVDDGMGKAALIVLGMAMDAEGEFDEIAKTIIQTTRYDRVEEPPSEVGIQLINPSIESRQDAEETLWIGEIKRGEAERWGFQQPFANGSYLNFNVRPVSGSTDLSFSLRSPSGETLVEVDSGFEGDPERISDLFLRAPGLYIIEVTEINNREGSYQLGLNLDREAQNLNGGTLQIGELVEGDLQSQEIDRWFFEGKAGEQISIILAPLDDYDLFFSFYSPDETLLATFDESFAGDIELMANYELPFTGRYAVWVQSFSEIPGPYTLTVDEGHQVGSNFYDAGNLNPSVIKTESLQAGEIHVWFFEGENNDEIELTVRPISTPLDLNLLLLSNSRERLRSQDQTGDGATESFTITLSETGSYIVLIQDFLGRAGAYEILLEHAP